MGQILIAFLAAFISLTSLESYSQQYPSRPVRVVLPFPAGGTADVVARMVANQLDSSMGYPFIVDNRAGANGNIGTGIVARAAPDGYTLLYSSTAIAISPSMYSKLPYDTLNDFVPITIVMRGFGFVIVVHPSMPVRSSKDFIALAKKRPGEVVYSSAGVGNATHLAAEMFNMAAGIRMLHVPYKGAAPALNAVVSGEAQVMFLPPISTVQFVKDGRLRAVGFTGKSRWSGLPDVPTVSEDSLPGFYKDGGWGGWFAPAKTPVKIVERVQAEIHKVLQIPKIREYLIAGGYEPWGNSSADASRFLQSEVKAYADVVRAIGIKPY